MSLSAHKYIKQVGGFCCLVGAKRRRKWGEGGEIFGYLAAALLLYLNQFNAAHRRQKKRAMIDRLSHEYNRRLYMLETEQYGDTFFLLQERLRRSLRHGIDR